MPLDHLRTHANSQVDVMFHQSHASVTRPTFLVVVADDVLVVWVRMLSQVALDQVSCFLRRESTQYNNTQSMYLLNLPTDFFINVSCDKIARKK